MIKEILYVLVQFIAHTVQAITGFGGGPLAMPPSIALVGFDAAKASITLTFIYASGYLALANIKKINFKQLGTIIFFMVCGMIPGMWLYSRVPKKILMIIYGVIVVLIGLWKLLGSGKNNLKKPYNYIALLFSGAMQGMFTSGGPFLALYATEAIPDKEEFRATVSPVWTILNIYMCISMYRQHILDGYALKLSVYSIIPVALGIVLGNIINKKINQQTFLKVVYVLLMLSGIMLLINALA